MAHGNNVQQGQDLRSHDIGIRRLSSPSSMSAGSDSLFPSRVVDLPDELRGALLLPEEDEDTLSTSQSLERLSAMMNSAPSPVDSCRVTSGLASQASKSYSPSVSPAVGLPASLVDLGEGQLNDSLARSCQSKDWSLSDADLQDLLAQPGEQDLTDRPESQQLSDRPLSVPNDLWDSITSVSIRWLGLSSELGSDRCSEKETSQSQDLPIESPTSTGLIFR